MPIRERGNGFQVDVKVKGERIRKTVYGSREYAEGIEAEIRAALLSGREVQASEVSLRTPEIRTLQESLDKAKVRWRGSKSERTSLVNAKVVTDYFDAACPVRTITAERVSEFVDHLLEEKGNSTSTVNRKLSALRVMLTQAYDLDWIDKVPKMPHLRERKHRVVFYTPEEEEKILETLEALGCYRLRDLVVFLIDTGLRLGEARSLKWPEVQIDAVEVVDTKTDHDRRVPFTRRVVGLMQRLKKEQGDRPGPFHGLVYGRDIYQPWQSVRVALGRQDDEQFVIHGLRHTFCSRLVQRGVQLQVVKELAGHKEYSTTLRYAHLAPSNLEDAVAVLD